MDNFWSLQPYNAQPNVMPMTSSSSMSLGNNSYDSLDNPYNTYLQRTPPQEIVTSTFPSLSEPSDSAPIKNGKYLDDLYLSTWIKSTGYKPHRQGFYLDGKNSYFEINGQLVIGGPQIGTGIVFSSNDIFLLENTVGGFNTVTGDTTSIYFVRSDDTDPYNPVLSSEPRGILQKRKGINSNNENVFEWFFDQRAFGNGKNYIFIGRSGDTSVSTNNITDFPTNVINMTVSDHLQIEVLATRTGSSNVAIDVHNENYNSQLSANFLNSGGSRMFLSTSNPTSPDYFYPGKYLSGVWGGSGFLFINSDPVSPGIIMVIDPQNIWISASQSLSPTGNSQITLGTSYYTWLSTYSDSLYLTPKATGLAPAGAEGGLYADSTTHTLKYYNGTSWTSLSTGGGNMVQTIGTSLPSASTYSGQYYYMSSTDILYRSNGTAWIAIN